MVGRQGRLAGAGQAEKDRAVALGPDIGRAVHRQHVARRQHEVEIAEHRFLDLAGIAGAADQDEPGGEVDQDRGLGADPVEPRYRAELRRVQDREGRLEIRQLGRRGPDEHVARKEAVPGAVADHPDRQPVLGVGAGIEILNEQLLTLQIGQHPLLQAVETRRRDRLVDVAPGDRVFRAGLVDDVFVLGRAAGMPPGIRDKAAAEPELALVPPHRMLVEIGRRQVPMHHAEMVHSLLAKAEAGRARCQPFVRLVQAFLHHRRACVKPARAPAQRLGGRINPADCPGKQTDCGVTAGSAASASLPCGGSRESAS